MSLRIYNTLNKKEEEFTPLRDKKVAMYVCGPTVYDILHVGNFRGVIFFNAVRNWLEHLGYDVTYAYNYTDVDDKIINRAKEEGATPDKVSARYIKEFEQDFNELKLRAHDHNPRATDYIKQMVEAIQTLVDKEKAYVVDGEVIYSVDSFKDYGKLSGKNLEELESGHRVEVDTRKKNPLDFVLWKPSKEGEPSWDSPWGPGRPGWHIECSVMSKALLGETIDIHGGGIDLIFPHHENEIAQSEGASDKPFVRYWMHNNFINFGDTKMSKSLGNVVTGRAFLEKYNTEILKFLILSVHYRTPLSLADTQIHQAIAALARIYAAIAQADEVINGELNEEPNKEFEKQLHEATDAITESFNADFNTPAAFAKVFDVVRSFKALCQQKPKPDGSVKAAAVAFKAWIGKYGTIMSLFQEEARGFLKELDKILIAEKGLDERVIEKKIEERSKARGAKDFERADTIRDELLKMGIELKDGPEGTSWEAKKG